jgi:cold shock protein
VLLSTLMTSVTCGPFGPGLVRTSRVAPGRTGSFPRPERPDAFPSGGQATVEEFGTVKFFAANKGFGFIIRDLGGKDVFVHVSALNRAGLDMLADGQRVAMDVSEGRRGPEATNLRLI